MKNQRHKAILEIINEQPVATQEALMLMLAERGIRLRLRFRAISSSFHL